MDPVDILDAGIHTVAGLGNDTWDAVRNGEDQDTFEFSFGDLGQLAQSAVRDAMLGEWPVEAVFLGSSSDSYSSRENSHVRRPRLADEVARYMGIEESFQFANACASSSYAIAAAMDAIRDGQFDVVIAGGADQVTLSAVAGFQAVRIYGERCLPFSVGRKKLVLSDGAAFVVLAREGLYDTAIAKIEGAGLVSGASSMAHMTGEGPYRALKAAVEESGDNRLDLIIAHGTGTIVNDKAESEAIARWLGIDPIADDDPRSEADFPRVVSYKRWLGHPQGASGAIGVVLALEAMERGEVFPTTDVVDTSLVVSPLVTTRAVGRSMSRAAVLSHGTWDVYSALILSGAF